MRTLEELEKMMFDTLTKYENHLEGSPETWTLKISDIDCLGVCYSSFKVIVLNKWMVENSPIDQIVDTLMHECAHAFADEEYTKTGRRMVHGKEWKRWARRLGANPKATVPLSQIGEGATEQFSRKSRPNKYHIVYVDKLYDPSNIEVISSCKRKLVRLENRRVKGREETHGRLWHIDIQEYDRLKDNPKKLVRSCFR